MLMGVIVGIKYGVVEGVLKGGAREIGGVLGLI